MNGDVEGNVFVVSDTFASLIEKDEFPSDSAFESYKDGVPSSSWDLDELLQGYLTPWEELDRLFCRVEENGFGELSAGRLGELVEEREFAEALSALVGPAALTSLAARARADPRHLTYQEFITLVSHKRRHSFQAAVGEVGPETAMGSPLDPGLPAHSALPLFPKHSAHKSPPLLQSHSSKLAWRLAAEFAPGQDVEERKAYALRYRCLPPPLFLPALTLLQVGLFLYYSLSEGGEEWRDWGGEAWGPVPITSPLVFRWDRRSEVWRFLSYALLHAGLWHLVFNVAVQALVGIPLEMAQGSLRVALVYGAGVVAGSLGTSVLDSRVYLVGGSGGVYALLAAHVANVFLNFHQIDCGLFYVVTSLVIGSVDVGLAVWNRYSVSGPSDHPVSYVAHFAGAFAGLCVGVGVLRRLGGGGRGRWAWLGPVLFASLAASAVTLNLLRPTPL